jgi:hypothetical protein
VAVQQIGGSVEAGHARGAYREWERGQNRASGCDGIEKVSG